MIKRGTKVNKIIQTIQDHNYPASVKLRLGLNKYEKRKKVYLNLINKVEADFFVVHARYGVQTLDDPAIALSGGQQQRLCLARSIALEPEILLLDEPTSGLDPISTAKVEDALVELKKRYTVILVPHSVQQAARTSDYAAFFLQGKLIEYAPGTEIFTNPKEQQTEDYVTGRFG